MNLILHVTTYFYQKKTTLGQHVQSPISLPPGRVHSLDLGGQLLLTIFHDSFGRLNLHEEKWPKERQRLEEYRLAIYCKYTIALKEMTVRG
jgi:hypothetical protein